MFVTTRTLQASYEARLRDMERSHAAQIEALLAHIESLKRLVFSPAAPGYVPSQALEADAILSVRETTIELTEEEMKRREEEISERSRILSGQY